MYQLPVPNAAVFPLSSGGTTGRTPLRPAAAHAAMATLSEEQVAEIKEAPKHLSGNCVIHDVSEAINLVTVVIFLHLSESPALLKKNVSKTNFFQKGMPNYVSPETPF